MGNLEIRFLLSAFLFLFCFSVVPEGDELEGGGEGEEGFGFVVVFGGGLGPEGLDVPAEAVVAGLGVVEGLPGGAVVVVEEGAEGLEPGTPTIKTYDQDRALAHITCGSQLMDIVKDGRDHFYVLTRLSFHNIDLEPLWNAYNANAVFPALRWHPFGLAIQALHCLRERRKIIHPNRYITISHRTHTHKGAAVPENAEGAIFGQVQSTLGVKL